MRRRPVSLHLVPRMSIEKQETSKNNRHGIWMIMMTSGPGRYLRHVATGFTNLAQV